MPVFQGCLARIRPIVNNVRMAADAKIQSIYRYPVKGLSPEKLTRTRLEAGQPLPGDRQYAIENGPSGFDPAAPAHLHKLQFLMLVKNDRLATLDTRYDDATRILVIRGKERELARGDLATKEGRLAIEAFFRRFMSAELRGPPKILQAPGHSFSNVAPKVVSIINLASVAALEAVVGVPVHPLRFRGNIYVEGWPAWHEFGFVGQQIAIASARLKVVKRIVRCPATDVDPQTGVRDLSIPGTLMRTYNHADCGIYAQVIEGGDIATGDALVTP